MLNSWLLVLWLLCLPAAHADNAALQDLFFAACVNPQGLLAARCGETPAGLGDLSSDSESSLNPSQVLGGHDGGLGASERLTTEIQERLRGGQSSDDERLSVGPFSLLVNLQTSDTEYDRRPDIDPERGYQRDHQSLDLGFDYRVSDRLVIGALTQWQHADLSFDREADGIGFSPVGAAGDIESDGLGFALYASRTLGATGYLDLSLAHIRTTHDIRRSAIFQESTRTLAQQRAVSGGKTDGATWNASISAGWTREIGNWSLHPFGQLTWLRSRIDSFIENDLSNTGLAMSIDTSRVERLLAAAGLRISRPFSFAGGVLIPSIRVQYNALLTADEAEATASFVNDLGGNTLDLTGSDPDDGYWHAGFGLHLILPRGWMPFLELELTEGVQDLNQWRLSGGLRVEL